MRDLVTDFFGQPIPFWLPAWMVALPVAFFKLGGSSAPAQPAPKPAPPPTPPAASAATASTRALIRDIASLRSRSSTVLMHRSRDVLRPGSSGWAPPGGGGLVVTPPADTPPTQSPRPDAPTGGAGPVDALPTSPWNPNGSTPPAFGPPAGSIATGGSSNAWFTPPATATQPQLPPSIVPDNPVLLPVDLPPAWNGGYNYGGGASSVIERTTGDTLFPDLLQVVTGRENDQDHSVYLER